MLGTRFKTDLKRTQIDGPCDSRNIVRASAQIINVAFLIDFSSRASEKFDSTPPVSECICILRFEKIV